MTFELIRDIFAWCTVIHIGLLACWGVMFFIMPDFIFRIHSRLFEMERRDFNKIHYTGMAYYKILIFVFCLVPYLAMRIVG